MNELIKKQRDEYRNDDRHYGEVRALRERLWRNFDQMYAEGEANRKRYEETTGKPYPKPTRL